ncbi:MAG: endonuclease/exonuclease/phosphatase family protein [Acidobacteriota bacterium]
MKRFRAFTAGLALTLLGAAGCSAPPSEPQPPIRVALFNIKELSLEKLRLLDATGRGHDEQLIAAARIIAEIRPDVLVVQEIDRPPGDLGTEPARLFLDSYVRPLWPELDLPYLFADPSNTGELTGLDLNGDGILATAGDVNTRQHGDDSFGFGTYPGQYSMAVYSRYELDEAAARSFRKLLWRDLPGNHLPTGFYSAEAQAALRLSSKSHWDLPVVLPNGERLHLWVSHPTPPVFDGDEDRNGRRNFDELRLWKLYADGLALTDDAGQSEARANAPFVVLGDLNARPGQEPIYDGIAAIDQLLTHPAIQDSGPWTVSEGALAGRESGAPNFWERATTDFGGGSRIDYVLPSQGLEIQAGGTYWPSDGEAAALAELA